MAVAMWGARLVVAVLIVAVSLTESAEIDVGGTTGWTTGFNYDAWVTKQNIQIRVGDTLVFRNPDTAITHTVGLVPDADSYQRCLIGGATNITPIPPSQNFTFVVPAGLAGQTLYAVCTVAGHCLDSQKIHGTVLAANATAPPTAPPPLASPGSPHGYGSSDADMNRYICWTTAILLIAACFWNSG